MTTATEDWPCVELCIRWGEGPDRCIRHFNHDGDCMDKTGQTTTSLTNWLLGRNSATKAEMPPNEPEFD